MFVHVTHLPSPVKLLFKLDVILYTDSHALLVLETQNMYSAHIICIIQGSNSPFQGSGGNFVYYG